MKRTPFALTVVLLLLFSLVPLSAFAANETETLPYFVSDAAGLLTAQQQQDLESQARAVSEQYGCGVYAITIDDFRKFGFSSIDACAEGFYKHYQMGIGDEHNGILLLLSMNDRDYALKAYGSAAHTAFTDYGSYRLAERFLDDFRQGNWYDGFSDYIGTAGDYLARAAAGEPVDVPQQESSRLVPGVKIAMIIGIPILIAFGCCEGMKRTMKPVKKHTNADEYLIPGGPAAGEERRSTAEVFPATAANSDLHKDCLEAVLFSLVFSSGIWYYNTSIYGRDRNGQHTSDNLERL